MSLSDDLDALYRLPLNAFTLARNALAKRAGSDKGSVMALVKPHVAAWAVNQLYWRERKIFDALARASDARRRAHVQRMTGSSKSVGDLDARYRDALAAASGATHALLRASSPSISPATETAIAQTLEAIPAPGINGRLTTPVEPAGFSMLAALVASTPQAVSTRPPAEVVHIGRNAKTPIPAGQVAERRRAKRQAAAALKAAVIRERRATTALAAARKAVEAADQLLERLDNELRGARAAAGARRDHADRAKAALNDAAAARIEAERRLRATD